MITKEQWHALHEHVMERIKTEAAFVITAGELQRDFGITHPFWQQMSQFAQETQRNYTAKPDWETSDGEPTEIRYARVL